MPQLKLVVTNSIREQPVSVYQTFGTFPSLFHLHTLLSFIIFLSPNQTFIVLSNICHFRILCYLLTFYVIYAPTKCTFCTHHTHNALSSLIVGTLSEPIHIPNSPGVFGHRAVLTMGGSGRGWKFFSHRTNRYFSPSNCKTTRQKKIICSTRPFVQPPNTKLF